MKRLFLLVVLASALAAPLSAKDKNKTTFPEDVRRAQTVKVIIDPDAGEPLDQPMANATARDNVEKALEDWGRLRPMMDGAQTDLVIVVRTGSGKAMQPTIKGGPVDQRGGVAQSTDASIRIGGQRGQNPNADPSMYPMSRGPHISNEIGPADDYFAVYRWNVDTGMGGSPVWRYVGKDCLRPPKMTAVEEFRKALAEADKQAQTQKP
ncbi:MAG TPA: hypothetical protein VMH04_24420 [Candidatus Solibacter sp.]|nr:hypothetical protein [Candidatus Solibacter sp.]